MASIVHRNNRFLVVHYEHDISGKNKQKWETYRTLADAKRRKAEIERRQELGALDVPTCKTVADLLKEYVSLYGTTTWSLSVYSSNTRLIRNYINPVIGKMNLCEISPRILEKYYQKLLQTPAVSASRKNVEPKIRVSFSRRQSAKSTVCCGAPSIKLSSGSLWRKIQLSMPLFLRLYPKNARSGMLRRFFSHSMFVMMLVLSWLSTFLSRAACASVKFSASLGTASIFLRKASQAEQHPS